MAIEIMQVDALAPQLFTGSPAGVCVLPEPWVEVYLFGHATVASAHALWEQGVITRSAAARFHTRSGLLTARLCGPSIEMDFPAQSATSAAAPAGMVEALGVDRLFVGKNATDFLIEVCSEAMVGDTTAPWLLSRQ